MAEDLPNTQLQERIRKRLFLLQKEVDQIIDGAQALLKTQLPNPISFEFKNSAPRDVLTSNERAQSISFVARFEHLPLPSNYRVKIVKHENAHYIGNMAFCRHALNEFRPLIQNERDSVYYNKIHQVWHAMLTLDDPKKGTTIRVKDTKDNDVTLIFIRYLGERNKAIGFVMRSLNYSYLYNGILQHSSIAYSKRFLEDYTSGELNYVLWKHVHVLGFLREMLSAYYKLIRFLTYPKLGPLEIIDVP